MEHGIVIDSYARHKNLKLVGEEVGMSWQNVYVILKKNGVEVTGDKSRYGTDKDRLAALAESEFLKFVPWADDMNKKKYQSKVDFMVGDISVDIKSSRLNRCSSGPAKRWAFSLKKQELFVDYIVGFAFIENDYRLFLIPGEMVRKYQTISIGEKSNSKWFDFEIKPEDLTEFFRNMSK